MFKKKKIQKFSITLNASKEKKNIFKPREILLFFKLHG